MDLLNNTIISSFQNILQLKRSINTVNEKLGTNRNMKNLSVDFLRDQKNRLEYYVELLDSEYATISDIFRNKKFNKNVNVSVYKDYVKEHRNSYNLSSQTHDKIDEIESLLDQENRTHFGKKKVNLKQLKRDLDLVNI